MTTTSPSLATPYRTHTCGGAPGVRRGHGRPPVGLGPPPPRPRPADLPRPARPARHHPGRHRRGPTPPDAHEVASRVRSEFVLTVAGSVAKRLPGTENPKLATGEIELRATERRRSCRVEDAAVLHQRARRPDRRVAAAQVPLPRPPPRADGRAAAAPQPARPGDPRGPPRRRLRRGRDADPDQVDARRAPATSSSRRGSSRATSTRCRRARSSSSSC